MQSGIRCIHPAIEMRRLIVYTAIVWPSTRLDRMTGIDDTICEGDATKLIENQDLMNTLSYVCNDTVSFGINVNSRSICRLSGVSRYLVMPFVVTSFLCNAISRGTAILKRKKWPSAN